MHLPSAHQCDNDSADHYVMGKRKSDSGGNKHKKHKPNGFIDPNTCGVYATCNRGREAGCRKELLNLLSEKIDELYSGWDSQLNEESHKNDENNEDENGPETDQQKELPVEEQIKLELEEMKSSRLTKKSMHPLLSPIELGCECLVFIKVRRPAVATELVLSLCEDAHATKQKKSRFTQKISPISYSVSASSEELTKLAEKVLKPHFHAENQKPVKFAIQVTRRNFNSLEKDDIIKQVAAVVGRVGGHTVDLKNYDKLIMIECFKNNIGMSVVTDYLKYEKFNLQQIFEKDMGNAGLTRVGEVKIHGHI